MYTVHDIRSKNTRRVRSNTRVEISFKDLNERVVNLIKDKMLEVSLDSGDFTNIARHVIEDYVYEQDPRVDGFVKDNQLMKKTLIDSLYNAIVSWGKLTVCKENVNIREVQINGKYIFIDVDNGYELLRDPMTNEVIYFNNPEENLNFVKNRLVFSGKRMTEEEPLVNATTEEGYRIACSHPCINPPHPDTPLEQWSIAVIRKLGGMIFDENKLERNGTACHEMLVWIALSYTAMLGHTIAGTTGCGKTTIQDFGMRHVRDRDRTGVIQSPTEYHYRNMVDGVMVNNAIYWEVDTEANPESERSASYKNLVSQSLRSTISLLMLGELKDTSNFVEASRAINAGTKVSTTLHTFDIPGIIDRFALELVTGMGMTMDIAREMACRYLGPLTLCDRLGDGSRKVMGCAEVISYNRKTSEYNINYLYEFVLVDTILRDGEEGKLGMVWNVGYFVKRNNPSPKTISTIIKQLPKSVLEPILSTPVGSVLKEVNFDKLPKDYVVEYDSYEIPLEDSLRKSSHRSEENNIGIRIGD